MFSSLSPARNGGIDINKFGKQFVKLFGAHFKMTFREKQLWFWSIFYPVLLLVIFMVIFGNTSSDSFSAKIALVEPEPGPAAEGIKQGIGHIDSFELKEEQPVSLEQAEIWLKEKEIDAVLMLPQSTDGSVMKLILNKEKQNASSSQAISSIVNGIILQANEADAAIRQAPKMTLQTDYISSGSDKLQYNDFLLTGMIALAISQAGMFGMVGMVEMRRNGLLKRLMMTPVSMKLFGISSMFVRFILSAIQIVLLSLIGVLAFKANLNIDIFTFLIIFLVGTLSFTGFGFMIAAFSKSMESYMGIANLLSFIMMFLSGIFFDLSFLPGYLQPVAAYMPLTYFADGIRDSFVYGLGITNPSFWISTGILAAWGIVTFLISSRFYKWKA
ncbi:ABC transporter permease [Paenibacillus tarimensis]